MSKRISSLLKRIDVILHALPTYATAASAAIAVVSPEIAKVLPAGASRTVGEWGVAVVAIIAGAVVVIRKVTPVVDEAVGLLPVASTAILPAVATTAPVATVVPQSVVVDPAVGGVVGTVRRDG